MFMTSILPEQTHFVLGPAELSEQVNRTEASIYIFFDALMPHASDELKDVADSLGFYDSAAEWE